MKIEGQNAAIFWGFCRHMHRTWNCCLYNIVSTHSISQETMPNLHLASKMMDTSISMHFGALEVIANNEYIIHMQDQINTKRK